MTLNVAAIYERGVFRPKEPLPLADGSPVELIVVSALPTSKQQSPAEILAAIAALPMEQNGNPCFSGRDHDRILYGQKGT